MKYLLVLALVLLALHIGRGHRRAARPPVKQRPAAPAGAPIAMIACHRCGTHLPVKESLNGRRGRYCSAEHRRLGEDADL